MQLNTGEDAAFPQNLYGESGIILGYIGGAAFHTWAKSDWAHFRGNLKIPIWVAPVGNKNGQADAAAAVEALRDLGVPSGKVVMLDMEAPMVDKTYVSAFGAGLQAASYKVWVYGSVSNVFQNPQLNGYAVADPTGSVHMYPHPGVRMTQYAFGQTQDQDVVRHWLVTQDDLWQ